MMDSSAPKYNLSEQIYENSDKSIKIFKSRKKYTIQYIAVKMYSKSVFYENYSYEYNILKSINHPSIVKCLGCSEDSNSFFMEIEYCITGDLSKCLWQNKNSHYNEKIIKHVSTQILLGLQNLHKNGILHCNLKPSNILVDEYGNIKLCDFKKALKTNLISQTDIRRNKSAMTPCYTAPELFSEDGMYNFKTDLWALGCIMYEMAVGNVPFYDESVGKLMQKIVNDEIDFNKKELRNFSDNFVDILRRLLEKDTSLRVTWNEIERHSFWELNLQSDNTKDENVINSGRESSRSNSANSIKSQNSMGGKNNIKSNSDVNSFDYKDTSSKKKGVDILRLSRNAVQNMLQDREDEYYGEKHNEVDNADQEFKFDGKEKDKQDEYDSDRGELQQQDYEKFVKLKNPLEVSVLNVSRVFKKDKRRQTNNHLDQSMLKDSDIPTFESFITHQTDKVIKPIVGNKLIETITPVTFNKSKLPFQSWRIEKIKEMGRTNIKNMENYLLCVYSLFDQYYSKGEEDNLLNLLNYFESIIQDKEIANNIINTSFVTLFIIFLTQSRNDSIKIRVCSIIAFLIRYSTVIENPLDELGLCKVLDTLVKDKNVELSKKASATVGEYLFFVTTQAEGEEDTSTYWKISEESLNTLLYAIDISRDDVVKFYAVKSIENITALTQIAKVYFASNDLFLNKLIDVFKFCKNQELRSSAIYTVSHIIRLQPKLLKSLTEKLTFSDILKFLELEQPKIQQAIINILLFGLFYETNNRFILKNENFGKLFFTLLNLLENSTMIIKMKIILFFSLAMEDVIIINQFGEKLFTLLQKLRKENSNEVSMSIRIFENCFVFKLKQLTKNFVVLTSKLLKLNYGVNKLSSSNNIEDEVILYLSAFNTIGTYQKIISSLYSPELLDSLLKIVDNSDNLDDFIIKNTYEILKKFSENTQAVGENNDFVIRKILIPVLKSGFSLRLENKILPLNIAANLMTLLLDDDRMYSSTVLEEGKTKIINSLIITILPILKEMLKLDDIVFSSLSFLSLIIERNTAFIKFYKAEGIIEIIFELLEDPNFCNNLNLIKIMIKLIEYPDTTFIDILSMNLIEKVNILIANDPGDNSIYTEYVIELFYDLMFKINEQKKLKAANLEKDEYKKFTSLIEGVATNFKLCIKLLGNENINIQEKSCVSLIFLLQLFPDSYVESVGVYVKFTGSDIPDLLKGLDLNCMKIHKRVIRIFRWIIEFQNDAAIVLKPFLSYICSYFENICNTSNDPEIVQLTSKLLNIDLKAMSK